MPSRGAAAARLCEVHDELVGLIVDHTQTLIVERKAKAEAYLTSSATSATGRHEESSAVTIDHTIESLEIQGRIRELEEERDHLRFLIEHNLTVDSHQTGGTA